MKWSGTLNALICLICLLLIWQINQLALSSRNSIVLITELGLIGLLTIPSSVRKQSVSLPSNSSIGSASQTELIAMLKLRAHQDAANAAVSALTGGGS